MISGSPPASTVSTYCGEVKAGLGVPLDALPTATAAIASIAASSPSLRRGVRFTGSPSVEPSRKKTAGGAENLQLFLGEQRPYKLVERLAVAARDHGRRQRSDRRGSRDVHRQRDLAEVVAGPEDASRAHRALADDQHPGEDDVKALAALAFDDRRLAGRDLLAVHPARELHQPLARQLGKERAAVQL